MPDIMKDYFDALERLKTGRTFVVPKGTRITNDSVSLEAGRKKGTIKKSRPIFGELIGAINKAASERISPDDAAKAHAAKAKADVEKYRSLWEEALGREVSLIQQLWNEREAWARERVALTTGKVTSIHKPGKHAR